MFSLRIFASTMLGLEEERLDIDSIKARKLRGMVE